MRGLKKERWSLDFWTGFLYANQIQKKEGGKDAPFFSSAKLSLQNKCVPAGKETFSENKRRQQREKGFLTGFLMGRKRCNNQTKHFTILEPKTP